MLYLAKLCWGQKWSNPKPMKKKTLLNYIIIILKQNFVIFSSRNTTFIAFFELSLFLRIDFGLQIIAEALHAVRHLTSKEL